MIEHPSVLVEGSDSHLATYISHSPSPICLRNSLGVLATRSSGKSMEWGRSSSSFQPQLIADHVGGLEPFLNL